MSNKPETPSQAPSPEAQLATKLSRIIGKATYVQKTGYNKFHDYKYATEADVLALIKPLLAEERVAIIPRLASLERVEAEPTFKGKKQWITNVTISYDLVDGDTGYRETILFPGSGIDSEEKGVYKALTGSVKYFISKLFLIETGDDPEKDTEAPPQDGKAPAAQPKKTAPEVNHAPAEGKAEPRPGEKKSLEQATQEAIAEGDKKREEKKEAKKTGTLPSAGPLPTKEELNGILDKLKPYQAALGGSPSPGSTKLKEFILKAAGAESTKLVTQAQWNVILGTLEKFADNLPGLKKLVGVTA